MRKVLILGASGFIGQQCVKRLLSHDRIAVHALSRTRPGWVESSKLSTTGSKLVWHEFNLLNIGGIQSLIFEIRPDLALHAAWYVGHGTIWNTPDNMDWTAVTLTLARALVLVGCSRIVITGSCAEYMGTGIFREDMVSDQNTLYGKAKNCARVLVETLCRDAEVSFAWPRLFHMYGPHENEKRLISGAIVSLLNGNEFQCSDGQQIRDFLHVKDVANVLISLLFSDVTGVINVGSGNAVTLADILKQVGEALGREDLVKIGARPRAINDPDVLVPNLKRQTEELRWFPAYSVEDGISDTVNWWRQYKALLPRG